MYMQRYRGVAGHHTFRDLIKLLRRGDRLVFNDTRVIPARLFGIKDNGLRIECLLTDMVSPLLWKALLNPARRLKKGAMMLVEGSDDCFLRVEEIYEDGSRLVGLVEQSGILTFADIMERYGHVPLPHYIERSDEKADRESYQTVYARNAGAIAAPTAGLHFTNDLLGRLRNEGVDFSFVTLHVGVGTFRPVKAADPREHPMHEERYQLSQKTINEITATKESGGRIIAVGTTVIRVLEHCAISGNMVAGAGQTRLLILPPYHFRVIDGIITNFHLPRSTLLMLICAFAGTLPVLHAYKEAVENRYRFFSYGDAMLIL